MRGLTSLWRGWSRYRQIDASERRAFWYALFHLARLRWRLARVPLAELLAAENLVVVEASAAPLALPTAEGHRARLAVARAARACPLRTTCLVRALTELRLLRQEGWPAELCIGFRRGPEGALAGHAWVPHHGQAPGSPTAPHGIAARYRADAQRIATRCN